MLRRVWSHMSYANVMATVALFIAVGGSAYAALQINGSQIVDHSISASKLARDAVVPHAALADNVATLRLSRGKVRRAAREAVPAAATAGAAMTLAPMALGDTMQVIQDGPFTITASCVDDGSDDYRFSLDATSDASTWAAYDNKRGNAGTFHSGDRVEIYQGGGAIPTVTTLNGFVLLTSDGQAYIFNFAYAVHEFSACSVGGYAVG
jgi:hypothetical protein